MTPPPQSIQPNLLLYIVRKDLLLNKIKSFLLLPMFAAISLSGDKIADLVVMPRLAICWWTHGSEKKKKKSFSFHGDVLYPFVNYHPRNLGGIKLPHTRSLDESSVLLEPILA